MAEIGSTLREARMRARIDISEVEARTKIRAKYLRAIENEEWDLLPGSVYVKSFLRTYGDFLGLDSRLLIDEFKRRYERPDDHEVRPMGSIGRDRERPRRPSPNSGRRITSRASSPRIVIGVALLVIVVALYVIGSNNNKNNPTGSITPPSGSHHTDGGSKQKSTTTTVAHKKKKQTSSTTTTSTTTTNTTTTPAEATLQITATNLDWVCVEDAAGTPLVPGLDYEAGVKSKLLKSSELLVTLGNANATLVVNGKPYPISASANAIALKITPTGVSTLTTPVTCKA